MSQSKPARKLAGQDRKPFHQTRAASVIRRVINAAGSVDVIEDPSGGTVILLDDPRSPFGFRPEPLGGAPTGGITGEDLRRISSDPLPPIGRTFGGATPRPRQPEVDPIGDLGQQIFEKIPPAPAIFPKLPSSPPLLSRSTPFAYRAGGGEVFRSPPPAGRWNPIGLSKLLRASQDSWSPEAIDRLPDLGEIELSAKVAVTRTPASSRKVSSSVERFRGSDGFKPTATARTRTVPAKPRRPPALSGLPILGEPELIVKVAGMRSPASKGKVIRAAGRFRGGNTIEAAERFRRSGGPLGSNGFKPIAPVRTRPAPAKPRRSPGGEPGISPVASDPRPKPTMPRPRLPSTPDPNTGSGFGVYRWQFKTDRPGLGALGSSWGPVRMTVEVEGGQEFGVVYSHGPASGVRFSSQVRTRLDAQGTSIRDAAGIFRLAPGHEFSILERPVEPPIAPRQLSAAPKIAPKRPKVVPLRPGAPKVVPLRRPGPDPKVVPLRRPGTPPLKPVPTKPKPAKPKPAKPKPAGPPPDRVVPFRRRRRRSPGDPAPPRRITRPRRPDRIYRPRRRPGDPIPATPPAKEPQKKPQKKPQPQPRPQPSPSPRPRPQPFPLPTTRPSPFPAPTPRPQPSPSPRPRPQPFPLPTTRPSPFPAPTPRPQPQQKPQPRPRPSPAQQPLLSPAPLPSPAPQLAPVPSPYPFPGPIPHAPPYAPPLASPYPGFAPPPWLPRPRPGNPFPPAPFPDFLPPLISPIPPPEDLEMPCRYTPRPRLEGSISGSLCDGSKYSYPYAGVGFLGLEAMLIRITARLDLIERAICENSVAATPEWWQMRPGADRPQMIFQFAEKTADGKSFKAPHFQISVPWAKNSKPSPEAPPLPSYLKGSKMARLVLSDGSSIIVNGATDGEAKKMIKAAVRLVVPSRRPPKPEPVLSDRRKEVKQVAVYPRFCKFFAKGQLSGKPDWIVKFR